MQSLLISPTKTNPLAQTQLGSCLFLPMQVLQFVADPVQAEQFALQVAQSTTDPFWKNASSQVHPSAVFLFSPVQLAQLLAFPVQLTQNALQGGQSRAVPFWKYPGRLWQAFAGSRFSPVQAEQFVAVPAQTAQYWLQAGHVFVVALL